ncbi:MAG: HAMP domain-containing sensor histidine kinase [Chitinophagaceae bacterium]
MRSQTIRLSIFISTLVIAAIIIFQLIWLNKVYRFEQKNFDHSVAKSVRGFYEDLHPEILSVSNLNELIVNPNSQTFFIRINNIAAYDSTAYYLQTELEDEDIFTDCYMGIYEAQKKKYVYQAFLPSATGSVNKNVVLPTGPTSYNYMALYFPHRKQYILGLMNFWIISSVLLLIVLILLSGSFYYLFRQKFLNEVQKDFVNNFTHEFKTPVSVLNLAADVLENPAILDKPEKLLRYAAIVKYQSMYLHHQIERLLKHAHAETNQLYLIKEQVNIDDLVQEAIRHLKPLIDEKKAIFEYAFTVSSPLIIGDRGYLLIVIINLVENALKYSRQPKIILATKQEGAYIIFSVKDNGLGIEQKHYQKIFKKFYRIPRGDLMTTRGFGLGLPFVKRILQAHHGKVWVESIPNVGSNFSIRLPLS